MHVNSWRLADVAKVLVLMVQMRARELELVRLDDVDLCLSLLHAWVETQLLRRLAMEGKVSWLYSRRVHRERVEELSNPRGHLATLDVQVLILAERQRRKECMLNGVVRVASGLVNLGCFVGLLGRVGGLLERLLAPSPRQLLLNGGQFLVFA